jgi:hypothetical protein
MFYYNAIYTSKSCKMFYKFKQWLNKNLPLSNRTKHKAYMYYAGA